MSAVELKAKHFSRGQVNVSQGGYWREHKTGMFPEMKDKYRVIAHPNAWGYVNGKFYEPEDPEVTEKLLEEIPLDEILTSKELEVLGFVSQGYTPDQIASVYNRTELTAKTWIRNIGKKKKQWLSENFENTNQVSEGNV